MFLVSGFKKSQVQLKLLLRHEKVIFFSHFNGASVLVNRADSAGTPLYLIALLVFEEVQQWDWVSWRLIAYTEYHDDSSSVHSVSSESALLLVQMQIPAGRF